jgi:hypothetical protein
MQQAAGLMAAASAAAAAAAGGGGSGGQQQQGYATGLEGLEGVMGLRTEPDGNSDLLSPQGPFWCFSVGCCQA